MRLQRVRLTVRGMMVAVAVLALVLLGFRMIGLFGLYRHLHYYHRGQHLTTLKLPDYHNQNHAAWLDYHAGMARKYARAARYPWLPVSPDPPEPK